VLRPLLRIALASVAGALIGGAVAWVALRARWSEPRPQVAPLVWPAPGAAGHSPFALLAQEASRGVVNVHTSRTVSYAPGPFLGPFSLRPDVVESVPSLGTGFVISADGEILTNNHVVDGVDRIRVVFADGTQADAKIVGQDEETDLALIRVEGRTDLHPLTLGDSDSILPGDWVVAIGNPFGLDHTVTVGIVSAKGRDIGQGRCDAYVQTDAAINPGNSGGPLLDLNGRVVAISAAMKAEANTIGFAVPAEVARRILPQLREYGRVRRGWLGVGVQPLTPELASVLGVAETIGAIVGRVDPHGPAAAAGLRRGDVIVSFQGEPLGDLRAMFCAVAEAKQGERVALGVVREGRRIDVEAAVGHAGGAVAQAPAAPQAPAVPEAPSPVESWGFAAQSLTPELAARLEELAAALEPADRPALLVVRRGPATAFVLIERVHGGR
jgi:serine protease Do